MIRLLLCILSISAPLVLTAIHAPSTLAELEEKNSDKEVQIIRILIAENIEGALVDVKGGYKVINPENGKTLSSGSSQKRYYLQTTPSGLKWGEGYIGIHQIKIVPKDKNTSILIDGMQYNGSLVVYDINNKIQLVNEIDVETCLKATLSHKFSESHLYNATYEAITIAERTNLYDIIFKRQNPYWDAKAKDLSYEGSGAILIHSGIESAVTATKHLIMTYEDRPFPTLWSENSGGRTANYVDIFRKKAQAPNGVAVAYAQKMREDFKWKCVLSTERLAKTLHLDKITGIDLFQEPSAKKTYALRVTDGKNFVEMTFAEFQEKIGANRILSNDISVHLLKENIVFEGYGRGFGVGLCLFSANEMAKIGDTATQILTYFYPDTNLVKLGIIPEALKSPLFGERP